jgi:hypothetical protein
VKDGRAFLARSLPPLLAQVGRGLLEVLVVDDGSGDGSGAFAAGQGARVLATGGPLGPAAARNRGAREARGDLLLFVDADVVAHPDAADVARAAFAEPAVVAVFGSYDDAPPERSFASQYMNLRHHFVHQRGAGEATTFWAGLGAVRREAFLAVGGYDAERYAVPSIEDIELGYRLRAAGGRILNLPALQGTHLKRWTLGGVVHTDVVCRALPWARLLLARAEAVPDLNTGRAEQAKALLAAALAASLPLAAAGVLSPLWPPALFAAAVAANADLFALFRRRRGLPFALGALAFHQLYYLYASAAYAWCAVEQRLRARPAAGAAGGGGGAP